MAVRQIYNAKIVMPDRVIPNGTIVIKDDTIEWIEEGHLHEKNVEDTDAAGSWAIPGLVDSHSDAIEMELEPRPGSVFPIQVSFRELEKKLAGQGITTIYHSLSLLEENAKKWTRQNDKVFRVIDDINRLSKSVHLIRHKTHLRFEITNVEAVPNVRECIEANKVDQLSFMDHTSGQGQFRNLEVHKKYLIEHRHYTEEQADRLIEESRRQQKLEPAVLRSLAECAFRRGIPIASHDDDTIDKLALVKSLKATISEFPVELDVAKKAKEMGLYVVMGAPNALLGRSHSHNLSAMEAVEHDVVDILCSDYYPASLLHAVFKLYHRGMAIWKAVNMVTLNPAKALKIDHEVGSLEPGKKADILIVSEDDRRPVLQKVFVGGQVVCQMRYQQPAKVGGFR